MTQVQINLNEATKAWLDEQVAKGRYQSIDDAIAQLVRHDQIEAEQQKLAGMLEEGLSDDAPREWTRESFSGIKASLANRRSN